MKEDRIKIAIIVGHTLTHQGAVNYLFESEYEFNKRIAHKLRWSLRDRKIPVELFYRDALLQYKDQVVELARLIKDSGCDIAISLHFNSYKDPAYGCEVLVTDKSHSRSYAQILVDRISEDLGIEQRAEGGIRTVRSGHRGHAALNAIEKEGVIAMIAEPCFATHRTHESKAIFENEDVYVSVLANACDHMIEYRHGLTRSRDPKLDSGASEV